MTAEDEGIDLLNTIERLRDRSHRSALSPRAWRAAVEAAGFRLQALKIEREDYTLLRWLNPVSPDEVDLAAVRALMRAASEETRRVLEIREEPDDLHYVKSRVVLVAERV
jgi:hypothetical protein